MVSEAPEFDDTFRKSIRVYIGYKKIIEEYDLDFGGLKCIFDLSDNYASACLAQSLINTEGFVSTCTSHDKGALILYMMKLINNSPTFMGDIINVEPEIKNTFLFSSTLLLIMS